MAYWNSGDTNKAFLLFQQSAEGVERLNYAHSYAHVILDTLASSHEHIEPIRSGGSLCRKLLLVVKMRDGLESAEYADGTDQARVELAKAEEACPRGADPARVPGHSPEEAAARTGHVPHRISSCAALSGRQKYADAEPLLVRGYLGISESAKAPGQKNHDPANRAAPHRCAERLVQLYDAWGKPDEAAKRRKELEEAKARFNRPS